MLIDSAQLTNTTTFSGQSTFKNYTYQTDVVYTPGLLSNTSDGINHHLSVGVNGSNAIDGLVAVMTVKIVSRPPVSASYVFQYTLRIEYNMPYIGVARHPRCHF